MGPSPLPSWMGGVRMGDVWALCAPIRAPNTFLRTNARLRPRLGLGEPNRDAESAFSLGNPRPSAVVTPPSGLDASPGAVFAHRCPLSRTFGGVLARARPPKPGPNGPKGAYTAFRYQRPRAIRGVSRCVFARFEACLGQFGPWYAAQRGPRTDERAFSTVPWNLGGPKKRSSMGKLPEDGPFSARSQYRVAVSGRDGGGWGVLGRTGFLLDNGAHFPGIG